jgi:putative membrane protein
MFLRLPHPMGTDDFAAPACNKEKQNMIRTLMIAAALAFGLGGVALAADAPTDPQIAHIAYTAGQIDIAAAEQAISKSKNADVVAFAKQMEEDHKAVNDQALALVTKLGVTPEDNPTSQALSKAAADKLAEIDKLDGAAFDKAYIDNEVAFHKTVDSALQDTLIPAAQNAELKALLQQGLTLFTEHEQHAEMVAAKFQ